MDLCQPFTVTGGSPVSTTFVGTTPRCEESSYREGERFFVSLSILMGRRPFPACQSDSGARPSPRSPSQRRSSRQTTSDSPQTSFDAECLSGLVGGRLVPTGRRYRCGAADSARSLSPSCFDQHRQRNASPAGPPSKSPGHDRSPGGSPCRADGCRRGQPWPSTTGTISWIIPTQYACRILQPIRCSGSDLSSAQAT